MLGGCARFCGEAVGHGLATPANLPPFQMRFSFQRRFRRDLGFRHPILSPDPLGALCGVRLSSSAPLGGYFLTLPPQVRARAAARPSGLPALNLMATGRTYYASGARREATLELREVLQHHPIFGRTYIPEIKARIALHGQQYLIRTNSDGFPCRHEFMSSKESPGPRFSWTPDWGSLPLQRRCP